MSSEALLVKESHEHKSAESGKESAYEVLQALFFLVAFSTGLGILGSVKALNDFHIDSLLADFIIVIFVVVTNAINQHLMIYSVTRKEGESVSQEYNYAEFLEDKFGKKAAMVYDISMTVHNFILLAYIQSQISGYIFGDLNSSGNTSADSSYYLLALINIPLIFVSITGDFKKIKWFCIVLTIAWIYIFTGSLIETISNNSSSELGFSFTSSDVGTWVIKLIGFQIYYTSAFQSIPFIYQEVKSERSMKNVINLSAVLTIGVFFSVYIYSGFEEGGVYATLKAYGFALIGACAVVVNVIPARFSLAQFLAQNDSNNLKVASASDRFLSTILLLGSIIISLFLVNPNIWDVIIGIAVILSSVLGILLPPLAYLFTNKAKGILKSHGSHKGLLIGYSVWAGIVGLAGIVSGFFIIFDGRNNS